MTEGRKTKDLEPTEVAPIDEKRETIRFPWFIAIIMGILMVAIIACFIVVMILGPVQVDTSTTSSIQSISSSVM